MTATLEQILAHKHTGIVFLAYLKKIHAEEELEFWMEVELFRKLSESWDCLKETKRIYKKFLSCASKTEINIEGTLKERVHDTIERGVWDQHLFDTAQQNVYETLNFNCVRSFRVTMDKKKATKKESDLREAEAGTVLLQLYKKYRQQKKGKGPSSPREATKAPSSPRSPRGATLSSSSAQDNDKEKDKGKEKITTRHKRRPSFFASLRRKSRGPIGAAADTFTTNKDSKDDANALRRHSDVSCDNGVRAVVRPRSSTRIEPLSPPLIHRESSGSSLKKSASAPFWIESMH